MIGGFPHRPEDSFFFHAVERLRQRSPQDITSSLFTLGGFPVTRISKHLKAKCLAANPDIVVLQFAATDLVVPLRKRRSHDSSPTPHATTLLDLLKWQFQGLAGDVLRLPSVTPPEIYLETMLQIVRTLREHRIVPVIISPFVFGGRRSDRIARDCAGKLEQALIALPEAVYVDTYPALDRHPKSRMLMDDGSHLSLKGHRVVADVLQHHLADLVARQAWLPQDSTDLKQAA